MLDVIGALNNQDDYQKNRNYWKYLKTKLKKEENEVVSVTNQLKLTAPDGKKRLDRCTRFGWFYPEGLSWFKILFTRKREIGYINAPMSEKMSE